MGFIRNYALEVFREIDKRSQKNKHDVFIKEYSKLIQQSQLPNDVGCAISKDCSLNGCYRYYMCDFKRKKLS